VDNVAKDGISSQNFRHCVTETRANRLLVSANPGHIEPGDQLADEKTDDAHFEFRLDKFGVQMIVAVTFTVRSS